MAGRNSSEEDDSSNRLLEQTNAHSQTRSKLIGDEESEQSLAITEYSYITRLLCTSHFLSTWNSRAFEFGAFLFLATIYPQTLLPASVYALARAGSAAALSPLVGSYIDHVERLKVVRLSIVGQRTAVAVSCVVLYAMIYFKDVQKSVVLSYGALTLLSVLACVEKLSAVMNTISVERDWVVIIAGQNEDHLRTMNSQMRRIDLFCKLAAPLFISFIDSASTTVAIVVTAGMTIVSVLVEYFTIAKVYNAVPALRASKSDSSSSTQPSLSLWQQARSALSSTLTYFRHPAFLPSFSLALLYLTVLSFNGQMITYLLALGIQSSAIGILRGISALFELSATWIAPKIMQDIGPIRSGIWFINWQIFCVGLATLFLWLDSSLTISATGTITAVVASRTGLWGFDLSAQIIVQEEVEAELRGTFSSQEFAFQNVFEMLSFASTIVFARPSEFRFPASISAAAVGLAACLYAAFVRLRRGHLVHLSRCMERGERKGGHGRHSGWRRVAQDEEDGDAHEMISQTGAHGSR